MMLLELGDHGAYLGVRKYEMNLGPWIHYRWSKVFQYHHLAIGLIGIIWRLRPYRYTPQRGVDHE